MKMLEKPPNWNHILKSNFKELMSVATSREMSVLLGKANKHYLYWDKFKYLQMPKGLSPEVAWACLKLNRNLQLKIIPLKNSEGDFFNYWLPDSVLKELHYSDQQAGGQLSIEEPGALAQERERYLVHSIMEEAIASSQLEGAVATRKVAKEMLLSGRKPKDRAERMILNNYNTIKTIKQFIDQPLTPEVICSFQESITRETLDDPTASGRFRSDDERIQVLDERDGTILHIPPPAKELPERINLLCQFANTSREDEFIHPIIKGIILHFWLVYDHPFVDGNGRTARTLFYWYLLKNKYWLFEFLSVSRIILKAPAQYIRSFLYSELDSGDFTYFILFHLRTIHLAIEELRAYLDRKQKELKESTRLLRDYPGLNYRQQGLIYHALTHQDTFYTIKGYKGINGVVHQTARTDLMDLVSKGFLEKRKKGKIYFFFPKKNLTRKLKIEK